MAKSHKTCMEQAEIIDTFGTYHAPRGRNPPPGRKSNFPIWQVSGGKVWESKLDSPPTLLHPKGLLATYIMRGRGGGCSTTCPQGLCATLPPLNPVAPLLDPGLDAVLDRNPLGFYPSSFLGGVHLSTEEIS